MTALDHQSGFIEPRLEQLATAFGARDEAAFDATLASLLACRTGIAAGAPPALLGDLRRVASDLQAALERFSLDTRLADFARRDMPDARASLEEVLRLTEAAAHRTLDLIERSGPLATAVSEASRAMLQRIRNAESPSGMEMGVLLGRMSNDMDHLRANLTEMQLAQTYQDLSGQIIRNVMNLVSEVEQALGELRRLGTQGQDVSSTARPADARGSGPAVPGVNGPERVNAQRDVDELFARFGM